MSKIRRATIFLNTGHLRCDLGPEIEKMKGQVMSSNEGTYLPEHRWGDFEDLQGFVNR
jgi:hypothetical protein